VREAETERLESYIFTRLPMAPIPSWPFLISRHQTVSIISRGCPIAAELLGETPDYNNHPKGRRRMRAIRISSAGLALRSPTRARRRVRTCTAPSG